jgi:hypothetical protein
MNTKKLEVRLAMVVLLCTVLSLLGLAGIYTTQTRRREGMTNAQSDWDDASVAQKVSMFLGGAVGVSITGFAIYSLLSA